MPDQKISADPLGTPTDSDYFPFVTATTPTNKRSLFSTIVTYIKTALLGFFAQPASAYLSGNVYFMHGPAATAAGNPATVAGDIAFFPILISSAVTLKAFGARVNTVSAGGNLTMGLYTNDPARNLPTGNVLAQVSGLSTATATVVSANLATPITLQPGIYWVASQADNTVATFQTVNTSVATAGYMVGSSSFTTAAIAVVTPGPCCFTTTGVYPTLPNMSAVTPGATGVTRGACLFAQVN